jgi:hypothetical protein
MPPSSPEEKAGLSIKGAAGEVIVIPPKEFYMSAKAHPRRMMLDSLSTDARRVYACLELATMGYPQELAVTMKDGKLRPLYWTTHASLQPKCTSRVSKDRKGRTGQACSRRWEGIAPRAHSDLMLGVPTACGGRRRK